MDMHHGGVPDASWLRGTRLDGESRSREATTSDTVGADADP